jgi:large subunit ribosomal protein L24
MMTNVITDRTKLSLKKGDMVQIIAGRDKGKSGKLLAVDGKNMRVLVEKLNMVKRHTKPTQKSPQGGIIEKETPIHFSNVQLMCPKCDRGVRHGVKMIEAGGKKSKKGAGEAVGAKLKKIRVCKKCGESLESK